MDTTEMDNTSRTPNPKKKVNQFTLRNLTPTQKKVITASGVGLAGIMTGAGAFSLIGFATGENLETPLAPPPMAEATETCVIYTQAPIAQDVHDGMSFQEAFAAARDEVDGGGGFFEWHGQVYSTYTENEWNTMSLEDKEAFAESLHNNPDFELPEVPEAATQEAKVDAVAANEVAPASEPDNVPVTATDNTPPAEPVVAETVVAADEPYELDINEDGVLDSIAFDTDGDGYLDVVVMDTNADDLPDTYLLDSDDDLDLDMVVIDANQDGITGDEPVEMLSEDQLIILSVDELGEQPQSSDFPANGDDDFTIKEDMPDLDDNADVSDFT
ncbi:MAG: hypothetical protein IT270_01890 [Saprospiraceae bacterium]|nr:hypothetical protein [Saprospiraceae bacterium]